MNFAYEASLAKHGTISNMAAELIRNAQPADYYKTFLQEDVRPDGRELGESRETLINIGSIGTADGSALVKLGHTTVMCGIKAELAVPRRDAPQEGFIVPNVELPALCCSQFKAGAPSEQAQVLSQTINDVIKYSKCLIPADLCIAEGKSCWVLYCDMVCLDYAGNVLDACLISLIAALKSVRLPEVTLEEDTDKVQVNTEKTFPLKLSAMPVSTSFSIFDGIMLVDPTNDEEVLSEGFIRVVIVDDNICLMDKTGGAALSDTKMSYCIERAQQQACDVMKQIDACAMNLDR